MDICKYRNIDMDDRQFTIVEKSDINLKGKCPKFGHDVLHTLKLEITVKKSNLHTIFYVKD